MCFCFSYVRGYCLWREQRIEATVQQIVELRDEVARMDGFFYAAHQAHPQETAGPDRLEIELAQIQRSLSRSRSWIGLGDFSPIFLAPPETLWVGPVLNWSPDQDVPAVSAIRQSVSGVLVGTGNDSFRVVDMRSPSFGNMLGSRSPNHVDKTVSESSQNRQSEPLTEATPRPEQATHRVIENFMVKMMELLEASMATRRNE
ncbi:hypothetical protein M9H77_17764 [Catharanthus roseus]|uniref:Uncharacterized protein n=1 Tax=Catharanthus roseus TaxID=4058 RepID=A0ACC0B5J6_CATRO|nr:hypothetical protein M9H77_17764 [Catharanthus roseus]